MKGRVLIVDDEERMCELLARGLGKKGFTCTWRMSASEALDDLRGERFDAVVTDINLGAMHGLELCERVVASWPGIPVIVITAFGVLENAVAAIRAGAYDFITKPLDVDALALTVARAVQHGALQEEVKQLRRAVEETRRFEEILGASPPMKRIYALLDQIADSDASVLITGESGTGKEVVARALHQRGRRSAGPFVAINCAGVPETLLESELFGHTRGAFTDARADREGLFLKADGGTLFLDEIADMSPAMQAKLLRALQERAVRPIGGDNEVRFDARILSATNRDLESAVAEQRFREDLYFRVNVVRIELPPLRARGGDILLLAQHFLGHFAAQSGKGVIGLSPEVAERLLAYFWPGNVRELQNCIERGVAVARHEQVTVEDLPERIRDYRQSHVLVMAQELTEFPPMEEVERRYILRVLEAAGGNKTQAAEVLGLDRKTLYNKLERFGLAPEKAGPKRS